MRDLKPGDRVKITGPWEATDKKGGASLIGRFATVEGFLDTGKPKIVIDGWSDWLSWCRENLRALPRRK